MDEAPLGDIGMLMPIMVATMTPVPLFVVYIIKCITDRKSKEIKLNDTELTNSS